MVNKNNLVYAQIQLQSDKNINDIKLMNGKGLDSHIHDVLKEFEHLLVGATKK